jgi:hypothetical protein
LLGGRYLVERVVGQGSCGRVFSAYDQVTGEAVALKEFMRGSRSSSGFLRELGALFELQHENIVGCRNVLLVGPFRYLVYEFLEAGSLRDRITNAAASTESNMEMVLMAAHAVAYAHRCQIIHRDLKPENILLTREAGRLRAKVADFGISQLSTSMDLRPNVGSPAYMAPEQFYDVYDQRVDIYALGVILYEIVCGARPFYGSPAQIMLGHLRGEVRFPAWLPEPLRCLLAAALAKNPDDRQQSADDLAGELAAVLRNSSGSLAVAGWPANVAEPTRVHVTRDAVLVEHAGGLSRYDRVGRLLEEGVSFDGALANEEHYLLRVGESVSVHSRHGVVEYEGVPPGARLALSPEGSLAIAHRGGLELTSGGGVRRLYEESSGIVDACFYGAESRLAVAIERDGECWLEDDGACRGLPEPVERLYGHPLRQEMVARTAGDPERLVLISRDGMRTSSGPSSDLCCDRENFYGLSADGVLCTVNVARGRVARTAWEEPLVAMGACSDGFVWAGSSGRILSLR